MATLDMANIDTDSSYIEYKVIPYSYHTALPFSPTPIHLQRKQIPQRHTPSNNRRNQSQLIPTRPLPRHILRLHQLFRTRPLRKRLELIIQRLHIQRRMQNSSQMHNSRNTKKLPVAACNNAFPEHRETGVCVAQEPERRDWAEELVANGPAKRPLTAEQFCARGVVGRAWWGEVDQECWDGHVGLSDCISWGYVSRGIVQ
jgi:hypothetical protein